VTVTYIIRAIDVDVAAGNVWAIPADLCLTSVVGASASLDLSSSLGCGGGKDSRKRKKDGEEDIHFE